MPLGDVSEYLSGALCAWIAEPASAASTADVAITSLLLSVMAEPRWTEFHCTSRDGGGLLNQGVGRGGLAVGEQALTRRGEEQTLNVDRWKSATREAARPTAA